MAITYPDSLDAFTNPASTDYEDAAGTYHDVQHSDLNDAVTELEAFAGVTDSAVTTSLDWRVKHPTQYCDAASLNSFGTTTLTTYGTGLATYMAYPLANAADDYVGTTISIPFLNSDGDSTAVTAYVFYVGNGGSAGANWEYEHNVLFYDPDLTSSTFLGAGTTNGPTTKSVVTLDALERITLGPYNYGHSTGYTGTLLRWAMRRNGSATNDTYGGTIRLVGVQFTFEHKAEP